MTIFPVLVSSDWDGGFGGARLAGTLPSCRRRVSNPNPQTSFGDCLALPFLATAASLTAAAIVFWIGRKIGKNGLEYWVSPGVLESVRREVTRKGAFALLLPALLPPPFPLLPFVLACGALSVSAMRFFIMFAGLRFMRFSILTALFWFYGVQLLTMFQTATFKTVMAVFVVMILGGIFKTLYRLASGPQRRPNTPLPSGESSST